MNYADGVGVWKYRLTARHSTPAMIRVQRSPQRKSRAMNPAFLLCDDLQAHLLCADWSLQRLLSGCARSLRDPKLWRIEYVNRAGATH